jgi:hypothetical protein
MEKIRKMTNVENIFGMSIDVKFCIHIGYAYIDIDVGLFISHQNLENSVLNIAHCLYLYYELSYFTINNNGEMFNKILLGKT